METDSVVYYYTCPAKATKYNDVVGITQHYDGVLSENNNQWIWVFDCKKFTTKIQRYKGTKIYKYIITFL